MDPAVLDRSSSFHNRTLLAAVALLGGLGLVPLAWLDRVGWQLLANTLALAGMTLLIALPLGTVLALLLVRTDLPLRRLWLAAVVLQLFVPLYVQVAAWRAGFGVFGWFTTEVLPGPALSGSMPLVLIDGWRGAVWVHAVAALPWVVLIVGAGLRYVEPELEEEALLDASAPAVFWRVTLRRTLSSAGVAALWVLVMTISEMTATDLFRVRTFTEELYTRLNELPEPLEALLAVLPLLGIIAWLALAMLLVLTKLESGGWRQSVRRPPRFRLGKYRTLLGGMVAVGVLVLILLPVVNLSYKAGVQVFQTEDGRVRAWSAAKFLRIVGESPLEYRQEFYWSLNLSLLTAAAVLVLATSLAWSARSRLSIWPLRTVLLLTFCTLLLAVPGPLIALAMIKLFQGSQTDWMARLYDQTVAPVWLALIVRTLPLATLLTWFLLRSVPRETLESAATDGAGSLRQLWLIALPQRTAALAAVGLIVFAQSLGDLSTTYLLLPPGVTTLQGRIFEFLHSSSEDFVAGICLVLLMLLWLVGLMVMVLWRRGRGSRRS